MMTKYNYKINIFSLTKNIYRGYMKLKRKLIPNHQLFYTATCPFCITVRATLFFKGLKMTLKDTAFSQQNRAELIACGGKSQVPCLRIEKDNADIQWMYESADIINYMKTNVSI